MRSTAVQQPLPPLSVGTSTASIKQERKIKTQKETGKGTIFEKSLVYLTVLTYTRLARGLGQ